MLSRNYLTLLKPTLQQQSLSAECAIVYFLVASYASKEFFLDLITNQEKAFSSLPQYLTMYTCASKC